MSSTANPTNSWNQYDSYKDCSQGVCSVYCPQWCYIIFPPPPSFFFDEEDDSSSSDFSPLLIALIGILASAFILVSYYTLISKYCHRRRQISSSSTSLTNREISVIDSWQESNGGGANQNQNTGDGLDESLIKSIKVYKFKKEDGFVESSDCSVCLSEFEENESLRLLPKCNHAFHLPCIDTWLKSHSNCPLCRCFIAGIETVSVSVHQISTGSDSVSLDLSDEDDDSVVVNLDLESAGSVETEKSPEEESAVASVVLISDILRESEDEEDEGEVGSSSRRFEEGDGEKTPPPLPPSSDGKSSFLVRSSMAVKSSVSNGKFVISRNYRLPN